MKFALTVVLLVILVLRLWKRRKMVGLALRVGVGLYALLMLNRPCKCAMIRTRSSRWHGSGALLVLWLLARGVVAILDQRRERRRQTLAGTDARSARSGKAPKIVAAVHHQAWRGRRTVHRHCGSDDRCSEADRRVERVRRPLHNEHAGSPGPRVACKPRVVIRAMPFPSFVWMRCLQSARNRCPSPFVHAIADKGIRRARGEALPLIGNLGERESQHAARVEIGGEAIWRVSWQALRRPYGIHS